MDPETFDQMIGRLAQVLSRRSLVGGALGAAVLGAVGLGEDVVAKKVKTEACIQTGKQCPSPKPRGRKGGGTKRNGKKGKNPKALTCNDCCQRNVSTNANGKRICACAPHGQPCIETRECCEGVCTEGRCVSSGTVQPLPPVRETVQPSPPVRETVPPPPPTGCAACTATQLCEGGVCHTCDVCPSGCIFTSVQAAIAATNPQLTTIRICPGTYVENLRVLRTVTIIGAGSGADPASNTILQGAVRGLTVISISSRIDVTLQSLRITGADAPGNDGGGIFNSGTLTLTTSTVSGNTAGRGGGIFNLLGTLRLADSTITGNSAHDGGGIFNDSYSGGPGVTLTSSTVAGNTARTGDGGGILNYGGPMTLSDSDVTGNTAAVDGGGIKNFGADPVILSNGSSVSGNTPDNCEGTITGPGCAPSGS